MPIRLHSETHPGDIDGEERAPGLPRYDALGFDGLSGPAVKADDPVGLRDGIPAIEVGQCPAVGLPGALADEAMATGLKCRIADMEDRLGRLQDRAAKRRQIVKDAMIELDLKKIAAPDFTASIRPGMPALMVLNEDAVPKTYWEPGEPRLRRQVLAQDLKGGAEVPGASLSNPEPVLSVRTR